MIDFSLSIYNEVWYGKFFFLTDFVVKLEKFLYSVIQCFDTAQINWNEQII